MMMIKNPWWILNSALAFLFVLLLVIILFTRPSIPASASLVPVAREMEAGAARHVDLIQIYRNDLFGTVGEQQFAEEKQEKKPEVVVPLPPPPQAAALVQPQMPQFLPPLAVTIKGIMYSTNELDNRAIIADAKSKREGLYRLGDKILDAEIIYIGNSKVMFIRSNGQQETLFVTQQDAQSDPLYRQRSPGEVVAKRLSETDYALYLDVFKERITAMAQFLDALNITTAWDQGKIVGLRVGRFGPESIATSLGLQQADIITSINGVSLINTENRTKIFHDLAKAEVGKVVEVTVLRAGQPITYRYMLQEKEAGEEQEGAPLAQTFIPREIAETVPAAQEQPFAEPLPTQLPTEGVAFFGTESEAERFPVVQQQASPLPSESVPTGQTPTELPVQTAEPLTTGVQNPLAMGNPLDLIQKRDRESMMAFGGRNAMLEPVQP